MIHKLRAGMMPPSGARRPAPDQIVEASSPRSNRAWTRSPQLIPNPGWRPFQRLNRAGVCARDQDAPRSRRRRDGVSPGRHDQRRFRQRRRRADVLADADGRLPARGQPHRDAGDRRSRRLRVAGDVQAAEDRVADGAGRGRAAGNARRHFGGAHLRRRRRLRLQPGLLRRTARLPVRRVAARARKSRCRSMARASRSSRSIRA